MLLQEALEHLLQLRAAVDEGADQPLRFGLTQRLLQHGQAGLRIARVREGHRPED
jgi:hypothetical protein